MLSVRVGTGLSPAFESLTGTPTAAVITGRLETSCSATTSTLFCAVIASLVERTQTS